MYLKNIAFKYIPCRTPDQTSNRGQSGDTASTCHLESNSPTFDSFATLTQLTAKQGRRTTYKNSKASI